MSYIDSFVQYKRRKSREVKIGNVGVGGENPVRVQTMLNTDTNDIESSVQQAIVCIDAGSELIRITAQGEKEAENLKRIKQQLQAKGYKIPIIADIHFNPNAAEIAAGHIEKVRINPGNYTDKKTLKPEELTEEEYQADIERIKNRFLPLLEICKKNGTAIRIGTNHGSLSDRIMSRFGDTPEGMAESAMEFLRMCNQQNFHNIVLSMKASNTRIMVYACRLLVKKMKDEDMHYPLHLGVTEAGDGEDGRIKSAVGIGSLLADGIGDTIRVSLTEEPEFEIPVAKSIVKYINELEQHEEIHPLEFNPVNPYIFNKRASNKVLHIGNQQVPVVIADCSYLKDITAVTYNQLGIKGFQGFWKKNDISPDYIYCGDVLPDDLDVPVSFILNFQTYLKCNKKDHIFPLVKMEELKEIDQDTVCFLHIHCNELDAESIKQIKKYRNLVIVLESTNKNKITDTRAAMFRIINENAKQPVIFKSESLETDQESFQIRSSINLGGLFIDGLGDGIMLKNETVAMPKIVETMFQTLQSTGDRITKTEYISCPSCGRTYFNLMETVTKIKSKTDHLKGLKIGVMGCIVNGPGEMADSHYGYVGAGRDKITLYKGKNVIERGIPSENAVDRLVELIKEGGDWVDA